MALEKKFLRNNISRDIKWVSLIALTRKGLAKGRKKIALYLRGFKEESQEKVGLAERAIRGEL